MPKASVVHLGNGVFAALRRMFDKASESGLKYPKIRFAFGNIHVKMTVASGRAKVPGSINVVNLDDRDMWYGRIVKGDDFEKGRDCTDAVVEFLKKFSADPVGEAAAYGKTTGNCCFCHKELTHQSSIEWGYGPICAEKWGLPHEYKDVSRPEVEMRVRKR